MASELFDGPTRTLGVTIGYLNLTVVVFALSKFFPLILNYFGPALTYWLFSVGCFFKCLFVIFFIPETKGKSFSEIQAALGVSVESDHVEKVPI